MPSYRTTILLPMSPSLPTFASESLRMNFAACSSIRISTFTCDCSSNSRDFTTPTFTPENHTLSPVERPPTSSKVAWTVSFFVNVSLMFPIARIPPARMASPTVTKQPTTTGCRFPESLMISLPRPGAPWRWRHGAPRGPSG